MKVFPSLCIRARKAGASRLVFTAELDEALADVDNGVGTNKSWSCAAAGRDEDAIVLAHGRTGEEALRNVVDRLEARR